jgi:glycosyltransferase involved in cell wall biosynthesis
MPSSGFECWISRDGQLLDSDPPDGLTIQLDRAERYFGICPRFVQEVGRVADLWRPDVAIGMNYQSMSALSRLDIPTLCDLQDDEVLHRVLEMTRGQSGFNWSELKALIMIGAYQRRHLRRIDGVALNSPSDARFCRRITGHRHVWSVPHGVDCDAYAPSSDRIDDLRVVFWGGLSFEPNQGAIRFFADAVWPRLLEIQPGLRWSILGPGEAPALDDVRSMPGVDWLGFVDDVRPHVARAAVAIVPMLSGAGIKNKVMEAWALGRPVLATPRAIGDLPGEHGRNVWLGRNADELLDGATQLLQDHELRERIGRSGRRTAVEECSWEHAADQMLECCSKVMALRHPLRHPVSSQPAMTLSRG